MPRSRATLLAGAGLLCGAAWGPSPAAAKDMLPDPKDVCVPQSGRSEVDVSRFAAYALDFEDIKRLGLDYTGNISDQEQRNAVHLHDFCTQTGRCNADTVAALKRARLQVSLFIAHVRRQDEAAYNKYQFVLRPGQVESGDPVADLLEGRSVLTCAAATQSASAAPGLPPAPAPVSPGSPPTPAPVAPPGTPAGPSAAPAASGAPANAAAANGGLPAWLGTFVVRGKVDDLPYVTNSPQYKGLGNATLGFDANGISHSNTYTASGVVGFQLPTIYDSANPGNSLTFIPYAGIGLKKVEANPHPKSGNSDTLSAGVLGDALFKLGFYHEVKFYPQLVKSYQDGSETVAGTVTYIPEPAVEVLGAPYNVGDQVTVMAQPNFSVSTEHVVGAGENALLRQIGSYTAFGPGFDLYLAGYPGSALEQFSANASYRYFHNTDSGLDPIANFQGSLSYTPFGQKNVSLTFKYGVGRDLATLVSQKDYTLNVGIKY